MAVKPTVKLTVSGSYSTSGVTLEEELLSQYPKNTVETALKLKAKYSGKYDFSDAYYLDYARSLELQKMRGAHNEIYSNLSSIYEITDPEWAGYSYEEIIEMENNGYKIPDDVLQWAHAQQQADVTSYVVITDDASTDDYSSTEEAKDDNSLDNIRQKAIKYITQADNSIKETELQVQEFQKKIQKANDIKKEQEDSYKESMNKINDLTSEWKTLDNKNKNGALTKSEQKRYIELGKLLNGKDGTLMSNIQQDSAELDDFLSSLESLNTKIDKNLEISQDVIQAGRELGKFSRNYNDNQSPHVTTGVVMKDTGLLSDVLFGVVGDEVADLAIEKGTDLESYSDDLSSELKNGANSSLSEFATAYSTLAQQTQNNTQNTMGEAYNKSSEETQNAQNQSENALGSSKDQTAYSVSKNLSYSNAIQSSITTIKATVELNSQKSKTASSDKSVKKSLTSANKDIQKLSKEASATQQKRDENLRQTEVFLADLEGLQAAATIENATGTNEGTVISSQQNQMVQSSNISNTQTVSAIKFEDEVPQTTSAQGGNQDANNSDKKQSTMEQLAALNNLDQQEVLDLQGTLAKNISSNAKYQKTANNLSENNTDLEKRSKNVQQVSNDTMFVGTGTFALGVIDNALGTSMISTGIALMANPFTYNTGMVLAIAGRSLQKKGIKENISGVGAMVSGGTGLISSASADDRVLTSKATLKDFNSVSKESAQVIKSVQQTLGGNAETADTATGVPIDNNSSSSAMGSATSGSEVQNAGGNTDVQSLVPQLSGTGTGIDMSVENQPYGVENNTTQGPAINSNQVENLSKNQSLESPEQVQATTDLQTNGSTSENAQPESNDVNDLTQEQSVQNQQNGNQVSSTQETANTAQVQEAQPEQVQNSEQKQQNEDSSYSVSIAFNSVNAIMAASTTAKATNDMENSQNEVESANAQVIAQTKRSETLVKAVEKDSNQAVSTHEINVQQVEALTQEYENLQTQVQNAQAEDTAMASQAQMENVTAQIVTASSAEEQTATAVNKTVANNIQQLTAFKSEAKVLDTNISSLDKKISNQLDVAQNTLIVGIGTAAVGITNTVIGSNLIAAGTAMMSNPFTFESGVAQVAIGQVKLAKGILESATGTAATVSGSNGISANNEADNASRQAETNLKSANAQYKDSDKRVQSVTDLMAENTDNDASGINNPENTTEPQNQDKPQGYDEQIISSSPEDETALAASASTNVNINNSKMTDEKEDKRLARFNNDSIIESKKKKKKVMAVSASSRG